MNLKLSLKMPASLGKAVAAAVKPIVEKSMQESMAKVGTMLIDRIGVEADKKLGATASEFKKGLHQPDSLTASSTKVAVQLVGVLPNALNDGFTAFDIKAKMLPHATHFTKDGEPYIDVPFNHAAGKMDASVKGSMDSAVENKQQALKASGATPHDVATAKARTSVVTPGKAFVKELNFGGKKVPVNVQHKSGTQDQMIRTASKAGSKTVAKYTTIRRISANSNPTAWWHPGFAGLHLMEKVETDLKDDIKRIFEDVFRSNGLKIKF